MTFEEYEIRMKSKQLQRLDEMHDIHLQAFLNHAVTDTRNRGNKQVPRYQKFEDFFNYEKHEKELLEITKKQDKKLMKMLRIANEKGG
ncbi:hypothetical protein [Allofustis seminis]|uniref:hypothetical protein n=1 Tax=Allofustis seminis TaxID=166939 RepID=UPI0003768860|nr:hypothetical protein [Allofustis seminis]